MLIRFHYDCCYRIIWYHLYDPRMQEVEVVILVWEQMRLLFDLLQGKYINYDKPHTFFLFTW